MWLDRARGRRLMRPLLLGLCLTQVACATSTVRPPPGEVGSVVAAENVWGSIASQLGGDKVSVSTIINKPGADPHAYEPTAADARLIASAGFVIANGIGYDGWMQNLLDANPSSRRDVLDVGNLVGVPIGGNPHQWYSPASVMRVIDQITATYKKRDPRDAGYFDQQKVRFLSTDLAEYSALISDIKSRYGGTPVGASESIFALMAPALGLDLLTPPAFLKAISEGTDPSAADKATIDRQIADGAIKVFVYNTQNATPDIRRQMEACAARKIPVVPITETLVPAGASFQAWQVAQLKALGSALAEGTGR
ncbi:MAG: metal ABC transporter solute-binding protein, Zn/Mn family [Actinomycetota bacterium]